MTPRSYLDGRVIVSTLPTCDPADADQPPLKRLLLEKGELAHIHNAGAPIMMIAYTELLTGRPRGNHFHRRKHEWMYVIRGACRLVVEDPEAGKREEVGIRAGDLVSIAVGTPHVIDPLEDGHAIEFSPSPFDPNDTFPHALL
jgi:mannose-6-phosphate isomerase-like protein (cupin superfamily)